MWRGEEGRDRTSRPRWPSAGFHALINSCSCPREVGDIVSPWLPCNHGKERSNKRRFMRRRLPSSAMQSGQDRHYPRYRTPIPCHSASSAPSSTLRVTQRRTSSRQPSPRSSPEVRTQGHLNIGDASPEFTQLTTPVPSTKQRASLCINSNIQIDPRYHPNLPPVRNRASAKGDNTQTVAKRLASSQPVTAPRTPESRMLRTAASPLARKRRAILPSEALPRIFHLRFFEVFVPSVGRSTAVEAAAATAARGCRMPASCRSEQGSSSWGFEHRIGLFGERWKCFVWGVQHGRVNAVKCAPLFHFVW